MTQEGKNMAEADSAQKMMKEQRILSFLGLATKARRTVSGYDAVSQAILSGCAYLVLVAEDASDGTARRIAHIADEAGVSFCRFSTQEKLGRFLGKSERAVAAVIDKGFADRLIQFLQDGYQVVCGE